MLGGGWTAKAETLYVNTGSGDTIDNGDFAYKAEHRYYTQRFGVNYLFGGKPTPAPQMYNWSGFYAGIIGGSSIAQTKIDDPTGNSVGEVGNTGTGYNAGGVLGFNYQFAPALVAGVEGDFSWFGIRHGVDDYNDSLALYTIKTHWLATARARLGYSSGPALFYVTGGGAWVNLNESWDFGSGPASATKTLSGYSVGGGIETVLWGGLTSRTEYLFVDVGRGTLLIDPSVTPVQGDHQYHLFRSSLTYKFGG
jgi:outer membrane immunogenic protein